MFTTILSIKDDDTQKSIFNTKNPLIIPDPNELFTINSEVYRVLRREICYMSGEKDTYIFLYVTKV